MFSKILSAIDGSEPSDHALTYAIEQASKYNAELNVLSVIEPTSALLYGDEDYPFLNIDEYEDAMEQSHKEVLIRAEERVKKSHPDLKTRTILAKGHTSLTTS